MNGDGKVFLPGEFTRRVMCEFRGIGECSFAFHTLRDSWMVRLNVWVIGKVVYIPRSTSYRCLHLFIPSPCLL